MSEFIVHTIPGSPFARAVLATLEEKALAYRLAPVAPGTFQSPQHLARHPFGRIPVVDHGDFSLYETQAVLRYVERLHPAAVQTLLAVFRGAMAEAVDEAIGAELAALPRPNGDG